MATDNWHTAADCSQLSADNLHLAAANSDFTAGNSHFVADNSDLAADKSNLQANKCNLAPESRSMKMVCFRPELAEKNRSYRFLGPCFHDLIPAAFRVD